MRENIHCSGLGGFIRRQDLEVTAFRGLGLGVQGLGSFTPAEMVARKPNGRKAPCGFSSAVRKSSIAYKCLAAALTVRL